MKKPLVIANWKSYVESPEQAKKFIAALRRKPALLTKNDVVIAPPATLLPVLVGVSKAKTIRFAGQTLSRFADPKHTGALSAGMLAAAGASAVIVGHSECREQGDTNAVVREQVQRAFEGKLTVILCVGEHTHDAAGAHFAPIAEQLTSALNEMPAASAARLVIAYEPIWAIGKSAADAMRPADLQEMIIFIRKTLADILGRTAGVRVPIL